MAQIKTTKGPNLTNPNNDYNQDQQLQMLNQLRLYFNDIDVANKTTRTYVYTTSTLQWLGDN
jgi:hypothetical protein